MIADKLDQLRTKRLQLERKLPWYFLSVLRMGYFTLLVFILTTVVGHFIKWLEFDLVYVVLCSALYAWASGTRNSSR